jgi:LysM repeat protein
VAPLQSCPLNINFAGDNLTHWAAYTGNNAGGNGPAAILARYDSTQLAPGGTIGATVFPEYNLPGVNGIQVVTSQGTDLFGGFPLIPTINGYAYSQSILLGSTSISPNLGNVQGSTPGSAPGTAGGYVRGITYQINVPAGPSTVPYTMTYAYAMVLENGTHVSAEQPMARAILSTPAGIITCASPAYFLPTSGGAAGGEGSALDTAAAKANGFVLSPRTSPNPSRTAGANGGFLQDIWTKDWTEVTFDLSPYRGQQVSLTFEADNCVPGGHFAYAYFALRNSCAGLQIYGDTLACPNAIEKFSVPTLDSATYTWTVPGGWTLASDSNSNSITVKVGPQKGFVVVREKNGCANLVDSLPVDLYPASLPEAVIDPADTTICYGRNALLNAVITAGTSYTWSDVGLRVERGDHSISAVPSTIQQFVAPPSTSDYILTIQNAGCPIIVSDTFVVTVVQPIRVNAGNDTLVVVNQPLQFGASSSDPYPDVYEWSPATDLSNPLVANPIGLYGSEFSSISYTVTATDSFGCSGTSGITVTIAKSQPDIFVPNAFTPGSSRNNLFRPVCYGLASLAYFRVFNRGGQMVFSTSQFGQGWDGRIQGILQGPNTYIWMVQGTDYTGRVIFKKGTMVLIR